MPWLGPWRHVSSAATSLFHGTVTTTIHGRELDSYVLMLLLPHIPSARLCGMGVTLQLFCHYHLCWEYGLRNKSQRARAGALFLSFLPHLFCLHYTCWYTHFQMSMCSSFKCPNVLSRAPSVLGHKCPASCRLKAIYNGVVSLCHDADFTPRTQTD